MSAELTTADFRRGAEFELGGVRFKGFACELINGLPPIAEFRKALRFVHTVQLAWQFWAGELVSYAYRFGQDYDQWLCDLGLTKARADELKWVVENVDPIARAMCPEWSYARAVGKLSASDQRRFLKLCPPEGGGPITNVADLRKAIKAEVSDPKKVKELLETDAVDRYVVRVGAALITLFIERRPDDELQYAWDGFVELWRHYKESV